MSNMRVPALVAKLHAGGQDFEFYPTTDEIITAMVSDINDPAGDAEDTYRDRRYSSVLDIGAGNGKVLLALRDRAGLPYMHAIEKSMILCEQLHPDILIVGTDFAEQSLLSKHVDVVFSNPPYSDFENWGSKIVRQAASKVIYLVLPVRWKNSLSINEAIKYREADCVIVGDFDFEDAEDRRARAKVQLLRIDLPQMGRRGENDDAFERFFREQFAHLVNKFDGEDADEPQEQPARFAHLVVGPSYLEALVSLYDAEIAKVQNNFALVSQLDADLLREFKVSPASIMACLKERLAGLRSEYWRELFGSLDTVTNRLTSQSRRKLLDVLQRHVHVDFTLSNIYAVVIWVIKNANGYIDSQLVDMYETLVEKCNVVLYKSNHRVWVEERWRCNDEPRKNSHYALDYRIVTHRLGGCRTGYSFERGLTEGSGDFIGDLLTLARNLGFDCETVVQILGRSGREKWEAGKQYKFYYTDSAGKTTVLFDVRAYLNGNVHLRLAKPFILALNVEHGRLKGWLRSRDEAVSELGDQDAAQYFNTNLCLTTAHTLLLPSSVSGSA